MNLPTYSTSRLITYAMFAAVITLSGCGGGSSKAPDTTPTSSASSVSSAVVSSSSSSPVVSSSVASSVSSQASSVVSSSSSSSVSSSSIASSSAASSTPETISGKAAAGAPIVGIVWVKDSNGEVRNSVIELDGSYSLDVTDMTAPFLLNARGTVAGRTVNYSSVAQTTDLGGNINITPFTDLILANVIGQITQNYFENPTFSDLSDLEIEAAREQVTARLQPVLSALGLEAGLDLLRESFNTNHTGLDAALDILRIETDPNTNTMTITNVLTQQQIVDDVTSLNDASALPNPGSLATELSDFDAIMARYDSFAALFATSVPADNSPAFMAQFDTANYLEDGSNDPNQILSDQGTGWTLGNYSIIEKISDSDWVVAATVFVGGRPLVDEVAEWHFYKVGGVWKLAGNQKQVGVSFHSQVWRDYLGAYDSHFEMEFDSFNPEVRYVVIEGPGLNYQYSADFSNVKGLVYDLSGGGLLNSDSTGKGDWLHDCAVTSNICFTFTEVKVGPHYTVKIYNNAKQQIGNSFVHRLTATPPTALYAQANAASLFPHITSVTKGGNAITTLAQATAGGDLTVSWTLPDTDVETCLDTLGFQVDGSAGYLDSRSDDVACDDTSGTVTTTSYGGTPDRAGVWIWLRREGGTEYGEGYRFSP